MKPFQLLLCFVFLYAFSLNLNSAVFAQEASIPSGQVKASNFQRKSKVRFLIKPLAEDKKTTKVVFRPGEKIFIQTLIKNDADEYFPYEVINKYFHYRPNLQKLGKRRVEEFRKDQQKSISLNEGQPAFISRLVPLPIPARSFRVLDILDLADWYENIEPGNYELTIRYRPDVGSKILISNSVVIKITP
jgi:hypothetical protein